MTRESIAARWQGWRLGCARLANRVDAAYATACDVPLLVPAFVERMFELLGDYDIAVPFDGEHHHPLAAVYRPTVLPKIEALLASERMRPRFLFDEVERGSAGRRVARRRSAALDAGESEL